MSRPLSITRLSDEHRRFFLSLASNELTYLGPLLSQQGRAVISSTDIQEVPIPPLKAKTIDVPLDSISKISFNSNIEGSMATLPRNVKINTSQLAMSIPIAYIVMPIPDILVRLLIAFGYVHFDGRYDEAYMLIWWEMTHITNMTFQQRLANVSNNAFNVTYNTQSSLPSRPFQYAVNMWYNMHLNMPKSFEPEIFENYMRDRIYMITPSTIADMSFLIYSKEKLSLDYPIYHYIADSYITYGPLAQYLEYLSQPETPKDSLRDRVEVMKKKLDMVFDPDIEPTKEDLRGRLLDYIGVFDRTETMKEIKATWQKYRKPSTLTDGELFYVIRNGYDYFSRAKNYDSYKKLFAKRTK